MFNNSGKRAQKNKLSETRKPS